MSDCAERERVTTLLEEIRGGRVSARNELCRLVYHELCESAHRLMPLDGGNTLQPTALVNEVMIRFMDPSALANIPNRRCLFAVAIRAMEQVLIDRYRARRSLKRGGDRRRQALDTVLDVVEQEAKTDFEDLHRALERLKEQNARQHEVVQLRFFGGLTLEETAEMLEVSVSTVRRDWRLARAKLYADLGDS